MGPSGGILGSGAPPVAGGPGAVLRGAVTVPSPPWQKTAGVSEGEEAGREEIAPRHLPADRACAQAVLALGYRHSLGCWGTGTALVTAMMALATCGSQGVWYCDSDFGKRSSLGDLTAHGFPNPTHFGSSKAAVSSFGVQWSRIRVYAGLVSSRASLLVCRLSCVLTRPLL